ncbi:hypothetical protein J6590_089953, partial [Homalodisca vitripennis]
FGRQTVADQTTKFSRPPKKPLHSITRQPWLFRNAIVRKSLQVPSLEGSQGQEQERASKMQHGRSILDDPSKTISRR